MKYDEFKQRLIDELKDYYGEDANVQIQTVVKNNCTLDGIQVMVKPFSDRIAPIIYANDLYRKHEEGILESISECVEYIADIIDSNPQEDILKIVDDIGCWDRIKDNVYPVVVSKAGNEELVRKLVCRDYLDLVVYYIIRNQESADQSFSIKITSDLADKYGLTEEDIFEQAVRNLDKDEYTVKPILSVIQDMLFENGDFDMETNEMEPQMMVVSNRHNLYGASALLSKKTLKNASQNENIYIIPSSIHELLVIPDSDSVTVDGLNEMIREVNETQVRPEDRLADHAYYFIADSEELSVAV